MSLALFLVILGIICFLVDAIRAAIARTFNGVAWGLALVAFAIWVLPHLV